MAVWEQVLLGIIAVAALFFFLPGINQRLRNSPKGTRSEWLNLLFVLGLVVLLVLGLIVLSR